MPKVQNFTSRQYLATRRFPGGQKESIKGASTGALLLLLLLLLLLCACRLDTASPPRPSRTPLCSAAQRAAWQGTRCAYTRTGSRRSLEGAEALRRRAAGQARLYAWRNSVSTAQFLACLLRASHRTAITQATNLTPSTCLSINCSLCVLHF